MDGYQTLEDVARDPELGLIIDGEASVDNLVDAIDLRLKEIQSHPVSEIGEVYQRLIAARIYVKDFAQGQTSTQLVSVQTQALELLLTSMERRSELDAEREARAAKEANEERNSSHRHVATTKATSDFRFARTIPFGAVVLVGIVGSVWSAQHQAAPGSFSSDRWTVFCLALAFTAAAIAIFILAYVSQRADEAVLKTLYDADVQADALDTALGESPPDLSDFALNLTGGYSRWRLHEFDRPVFRLALWIKAGGRGLGYVGRVHRHGRVGTSRILSTVDLDSAVRDASDLAISRFIEMGSIVTVVDVGRERFTSDGSPTA